MLNVCPTLVRHLTHFNHRGILKHCPDTRQFPDVQAMNEAIISRWNAVVRPQDTIYHLGDFGFSHSKLEPLEAIYARLNGHKHLIVGNHDEQNRGTLKLPWESISKLLTLKDNGARAELCHYPLETWKKSHRGALMLHGHCHGTLKRVMAHRFDVGFDVYPTGPVSFGIFVLAAASQVWEPADHHGDM